MDCSEIRISISARLDGEAPPIPESVVERHVDGCPDCRAWSVGVTELHRSLRLTGALEEPDRSARIVQRIPRRGPVARPSGSLMWWRLVTVLIALVQIASAVPLLLGHADEMHGHFARHLGVFAAALAVGLLMAAYRPDRAHSLLPVLAVLVSGLIWSCLDDLVHGQPVPGSVVAHAANVVALFAVWQLAHRSGTMLRRVAGRSPVLR